jgi:SAM-dependent methyltransferase
VSATRPDHARVAYDALAPFYDAFTRHHDYERFADVLEGAALDAGLTGRRLLDVACGTGKSFEPFLARGYEVTACDVSAAMLAEASVRAGGRARIERHDMRALPVLGTFDLVTVVDDAVNYLDGEELELLFRGVRANLAPGGVLVFDANTLATFRRLYSSCLVVPEEDRVVVYEGLSGADLEPGGLAESRFDLLVRGGDGWWTRTRSRHRHRHHPEAVVRAALLRAGLEPVAVHGLHVDGSLDAGHEDLSHSKALYTARTGAPEGGGRG